MPYVDLTYIVTRPLALAAAHALSSLIFLALAFLLGLSLEVRLHYHPGLALGPVRGARDLRARGKRRANAHDNARAK